MVFDQARHRAAGEEILARTVVLAAQMTYLQFQRTPGLEEALGATGTAKSHRDAEYNLQFLSEAISSGDPAGFASYLVWLDGVLAGVGLDRSVLDDHLDCMIETLSNSLEPEVRDLAVEYVREGIAGLAAGRAEVAP